MSEEIVKKIERLLELGKGDRARLVHILDSTKKGKTLFSSDQKYLDNLFEIHLTSDFKDEIPTSTDEEKMESNTLKETNNSEKSEIERLRDEVYKMQKYQMINQQLKNVKKDLSTVTLAAVLGGIFGINGLGHLMIGKNGLGAGYLIGGIISIIFSYFVSMSIGGLVAILPWFIFLIASTTSARSACREWNRYIEENLAEPGSWKDVKNYFLFPPSELKVNTESKTKEQPEPESKPEPKKQTKKGLSRKDKSIIVLLIILLPIVSLFLIDSYVYDINFGSFGGVSDQNREPSKADLIRQNCLLVNGVLYDSSSYFGKPSSPRCPYGTTADLDAELTWWNPFD